ncbi:MAG: FG-GAP-like repeat-containing protein, partial [Phycisphaerales bacterium]|nr:FG-GAP-like repeat-containing protein [Phycisphaerales bacterium]
MKRSLVFMLILVGCEWGSTPRDIPDAEAISRHNQAVAAMGAFNYQGAMDVLQPLAQAYPDWLDVQIDLSIAQLNRQSNGDDAAALDRLDRVLQIDPSDLRADYTAGILRLHAGQIDAAAEHFARVSAADPGDAYAAYHLGQARVQQGKIDEAIPLFAKAIEADPYLRSALYAGAQASRRMGMIEQAEIWLADFQRLEHNPRASLAEIKYTRMGPKAEVRALQANGGASQLPVPTGQIFEAAKARRIPSSDSHKGKHLSVGMQAPERSMVAIGSDQGLSLYTRTPDGTMEGITLSDRMGSVEDVTASMWGDVNADGHLDLVLCRVGGSQLWLGESSDRFARSTAFVPNSQGAAVDGALFDADHDGDLDVLLISGDDTPSELMNNNGDGTWSSIVDEVSGFPANTTNARRIVVADFDGDLDTDVIIIRETAPHDVYLNDRLWNWTTPSTGWESLQSATITGAVAADFDADGTMDLITTDGAFNLTAWHSEASGWRSRLIADRSDGMPVLSEGMTAEKSLASDSMFAVADLTGDGDFEILAETGWTSSSKPVLKLINKDGLTLEHIVGSPQWTLVQGPIGKGPAYLGVEEDGEILEIPPGDGRWAFVDVI